MWPSVVVRSSIGDDKFVIELIGSFPKFAVNTIVELYQVDIGINNDDDLDYEDGDESYDEEDDCSVVDAAAVRIRPVQEYSSNNNK